MINHIFKGMFSQVVLADKDRKYHTLFYTERSRFHKACGCLWSSPSPFRDRSSPYLAHFVIRSHRLDFIPCSSYGHTPRYVHGWYPSQASSASQAEEDVSLHTFVDASRLTYAAVSYIRYGHVRGQISVTLVTAKARVTPIKSVSIPRPELMAAVFGVRLAETVSE